MLENGINIDDRNLLSALISIYGYDISALDGEPTEKIKR